LQFNNYFYIHHTKRGIKIHFFRYICMSLLSFNVSLAMISFYIYNLRLYQLYFYQLLCSVNINIIIKLQNISQKDGQGKNAILQLSESVLHK